MSETTTSELLEAAGLKLYSIAEITALREERGQLHNALTIAETNYEKHSVEIKQLYEVLNRIRKMAKKDTRNDTKIDLVAILATIHSEAFVALKD